MEAAIVRYRLCVNKEVGLKVITLIDIHCIKQTYYFQLQYNDHIKGRKHKLMAEGTSSRRSSSPGKSCSIHV